MAMHGLHLRLGKHQDLVEVIYIKRVVIVRSSTAFLP